MSIKELKEFIGSSPDNYSISLAGPSDAIFDDGTTGELIYIALLDDNGRPVKSYSMAFEHDDREDASTAQMQELDVNPSQFPP